MAIQQNPSTESNPTPPPVKPYRRRHFSIFWPLLLIALGVFLFLNNVGAVPGSGWDVALRLWPLILVAWGLDGLLRRRAVVWSVVLTGLGLVFLLGNLGYLSVSIWEVVVSFWPVLLVAIGIDILIGRRGVWGEVVAAAVGLLLVGAIVLLLFLAPGISGQHTETVNMALNDAARASGSINMAVGRLDLSGGSAQTALLDGSVKLGSSGALRQGQPTTGDPATFSLSADAASYAPFGLNDTDRWTLHLNPAVTYTLNVNMAVGDDILDLSTLSVSTLRINQAVGHVEVRLPSKGSLTGEINGAVGDETIYVPKGANVTLELDGALTSVSLPDDYTRNGNLASSPSGSGDGPTIHLKLAQPLGAINVRYLP